MISADSAASDDGYSYFAHNKPLSPTHFMYILNGHPDFSAPVGKPGFQPYDNTNIPFCQENSENEFLYIRVSKQ